MLSLVETVLKSLIAWGLFALLAVAPCHAGGMGTVSAAMLNVRSGPGNDLPVVKVLARGEKVRVLAEEDGWLRITHGGAKGYIRNRPRYVLLSAEDANSAPRKKTVAKDASDASGKTRIGKDVAGAARKKRAGKDTRDVSQKKRAVKEIPGASQKKRAAKEIPDVSQKKRAGVAAKTSPPKKAGPEAKSLASKKTGTENPPSLSAEKRMSKAFAEAQVARRRIDEKEAEVVRFGREEITIINGLNELDRSLNRAAKGLSLLEKELADLSKKLDVNGRALAALKAEMEKEEVHVAGRLVALYKLNLTGKGGLLASAGTLHEMACRRRALKTILEADARLLSDYQEKLGKSERLQEALAARKTAKTELDAERRTQVRFIAQEKKKREGLLTGIRSRKKLGLAAIESLRLGAEKLDSAIRAMNVATAAEKSAPAPAAKHKGLLRLPVTGKIISTFGPSRDRKFNVVTFHSGVNIRSDRGEPVQAVKAGKVLYANWFKGYGNMMIIDHGDSYYTLYAHAEELFKEKGDPVEAREVIATVGDTGSLEGPKLHFEVRHHGKPIDPLEWLNQS